VNGLVFIDIEAAAGLDAIGAACAVLTPVDTAEFAYPVKSARSCDCINMIAVWHHESL
jgi:hypothetical protein